MGLGDNRIPEDKLPPCWSDDVRMNALFAPFRLKSVNPESWEMKMKFWSDMLRQWCRHKADPIVSAADARVAFQRKGRTPACLEIVIEECLQNGELSPISKYQQILHNGPEGWMRWGARIAFKPAALAFTAVSFLMPGKAAVDNDGLPKASIDSTQRFVLESAIQEQSADLLHNFPPDAERIGSIEELMRGSGWPAARRETFELLLGCLVSQGLAVKKDHVVKIADSPSSKVSPVSEADAALCRLADAERRLTDDLARLAREAERAAQEAKALASTGNRIAAKAVLRRKHTLLSRAGQCASALENVQQLAFSLRQAGTDATVVNTYKMSADALKRNMKEGGLEEDAVHDTMDDLKDVLESYAEVEKALSSTTDDLDAAELEEELREILNSSNQPSGGAGEKATSPRLPSPPAAMPVGRKVSEREFIFDGEERVLAELNELGLDDSPRAQPDAIPPRSQPTSQPKSQAKPVAVVEGWTPPKSQAEPAAKPAKSWYPREVDFALDSSLDKLSQSFSELRTDERLHPGQKLDVEFPTPSAIYSSEFQVRDHTLNDGVWLFNCKEGGVQSDTADYFSAASPGKGPSSFQMAPGGERKPSLASWTPEDKTDTTPDDLQRRLDHLRGFL